MLLIYSCVEVVVPEHTQLPAVQQVGCRPGRSADNKEEYVDVSSDLILNNPQRVAELYAPSPPTRFDLFAAVEKQTKKHFPVSSVKVIVGFMCT